jgi:leucyl aminopeptidase
MHITVHQGTALSTSTPLAALGVWQGEPLPEQVAALLEADDFPGKSGETLVLYPRGAVPARRLVLVGLGERSKATADSIRQVGARVARAAHSLKLTNFAVGLPHLDSLPPANVAQALTEGIELGLYRYLEHKSSLTPEQTHQVEWCTIASDGEIDAVQQGIKHGAAVAGGVRRARDLANAPGNSLTPARMAEIAQEIGAQTGMQVTLLEREALEQQGFGGLLAIAQGSAQPPYFIILEYGQPAPDRPTICLVGKGVTFDTGGISIKPAAGMEKMKMDMGGAAAVLGTMQAVGQLQFPLHVVALVSAAENMPDGNAIKPGDVITTLSGKTVEVLNTDAEGRVVLADALWYAQRYQPQAIVDVATLTGAMNIALGPHAIGLMSNHEELVNRLLQAGEQTAERVWQLPLWDEYREMVKSETADVRNTGGTRNAGAITAAAFLEVFVGDYPWAHLDIASTAWREGNLSAYVPAGATGVGVRLLTHMLAYWGNT